MLNKGDQMGDVKEEEPLAAWWAQQFQFVDIQLCAIRTSNEID